MGARDAGNLVTVLAIVLSFVAVLIVYIAWVLVR